MPIRNRLNELKDEITAWRRHLHQNPELMFDTVETGRFVAAKLREFGVDEVHEGLARTGVVGVIRGRGGGRGRVIGLRADMDALPIEEQSGKPWASKVPGRMHACGHDGHTAMLLGAARHLAETRNFDGTVVVIFQPAEEGGGGGEVMVREGLMERFGIEEVYGMHNMPGLPVGQFAIRPGPFFAAADEFTITLTGQGGHAAKPHEAVDTMLVAAHVITALQSIASRNTDPLKSVVVSVCTLETDSHAHNVIPERVTLGGTIRSLEEGVREMAARRLAEIAEGVAAAFGARAETDYRRGYPVMVNHERETALMAEVAERVAGRPPLEVPPIMGGEDFAFMLEARPGAYILVGNGDTAMVHHPAYDFNDEAIPWGASLWVELAEARASAGE